MKNNPTATRPDLNPTAYRPLTGKLGPAVAQYRIRYARGLSFETCTVTALGDDRRTDLVGEYIPRRQPQRLPRITTAGRAGRIVTIHTGFAYWLNPSPPAPLNNPRA